MKYTLAGLVALVLIAAGAFYMTKPKEKEDMPVGSASSPSITGNCIDVNGVVTCKERKRLATATTTPCVFKSPTSTSTITYAGLMVTSATSTATTWTAAKAATAYATTTKISSFALGSGALGTLVATTTGMANGSGVLVDGNNTLAPNTFLVWGVAGIDNVTDTTKLNGVCSVEFQII